MRKADDAAYAEYKSSTGLKAITKIEGFKNYKFLEQRNDDYKQLEEQVKSYHNAWKEFVVMNTSDGTYNVNNDITSTEIFGTYTSNQMPIPKSEALQYQSLKLQEKSMQEVYNNASIIPEKSNVEKRLASLQLSLYELNLKLQRYLLPELKVYFAGTGIWQAINTVIQNINEKNEVIRNATHRYD